MLANAHAMLASWMGLNSPMMGTAELASASQVASSRKSRVDIAHAIFERPASKGKIRKHKAQTKVNALNARANSPK